MDHWSKNEPEPAFDEVWFETEMRALRPQLRGYIVSIFPYPDQCDDILQETMVYAWDQRRNFEVGTSFKAWIFKIAYFRTLAFRRDAQREKVGTFSQEFIQRVAGAAESLLNDGEQLLQALRSCLGQLREKDLNLIRSRYSEGTSLAQRAREENVEPNRLQKAVSRLRLVLRSCVEQRLSEDS